MSKCSFEGSTYNSVTGEQKVIDFFAVMNAMYSDYHKVARKFGVDKTDFYAELAKAFLDDEVDGKAAVFRDGLKHQTEPLAKRNSRVSAGVSTLKVIYSFVLVNLGELSKYDHTAERVSC